MPHVDVGATGPCHPRERQRQRDRGDLRDDQRFAAVETVGPDAAEGREKKYCDLPRESGDAEQQRGAGEAIHQPTDGDLLHPHADQRNRLTGEIGAIVRVIKGAQSVVHGKCLALKSI